MLEPFCSRPLPTFATHETAENLFETTLNFNGIGRASALTYFMRRVFQYQLETPDESFGFNVISRIPTQVLILDMLVPNGLTIPSSASAAAYGNLYDMERAWNEAYSDRLPFTETTLHRGRSLPRLHTPEFSKYPEMIDAVLSELGWRETEFDIYRCRVEYPILHACVHTRVEAVQPDRPDSA